MTSLRMAERPPMRSRAVRRRRMQPPAAPAVCDFGLAIFCRWIEHEEEEEKWRDEESFGESFERGGGP